MGLGGEIITFFVSVVIDSTKLNQSKWTKTGNDFNVRLHEDFKG